MIKQNSDILFICIIIILTYSILINCSAKDHEALGIRDDFLDPPDSVKPWVYWYWYSDNISREGITNDLKAMSDVGIGTALIGNVSTGGEFGSIKALSEEWWDCTKFAIREADRFGIDIGIFNGPGWSQSGGPWIEEKQSMKSLHTKEFEVEGPGKINFKIPDTPKKSTDIAVIAYPRNNLAPLTVIKSAKSNIPVSGLDNLYDQDTTSVFVFPQKALKDDKFKLYLKTDDQVSIRSISLFPGKSQFKVDCILSYRNDAGEYIIIDEFELQRPSERFSVGPLYDAPAVISFPAVKSDEFKIEFQNFGSHPVEGRYSHDPAIAEIELNILPKLERYTEKSLGKTYWMPLPMWDAYLWENQAEVADDLTINQNDVLDITTFLDTNGILIWNVPEGVWTVSHIYMSSTGTKNSPVSPEASGLEVDKLNRDYVEHHFNSYLGKLIREMKPSERNALKYTVVDSYEKGGQNWTDGLRDDFIDGLGYDPIRWLPVLNGHIVESVDQSERFLWDLRRLIADKVAFEYADGLRDISNKNGLKLWMENYGHWGFIGEFLLYGGQSDIVSGEFWATGNLGSIELKAASSAAHIYGISKVCSESFTSGAPHFMYHPWFFKKRGDWSFTEGVNQTLLHLYLHQPYDDKIPGVNAWFGSAFNRHNTWFYKMESWFDYLKRCNYILQQGKFVADVLYYIGEDVPKMTGLRKPELPSGYSYDYINYDVIMNRLDVEEGKFILPDGISFDLLVLPPLNHMRPELLEKISLLVQKGGNIYGAKPIKSPSLEDYPSADKQVKEIADKLWQNLDGVNIKEVNFGKGKVFYGSTLETILKKLNILPDISGTDLSDLLWIHRKTKNNDIYFITNQSNKELSPEPLFRIKNKAPELWDAVDGNIIKTAQFSRSAGGIKTKIQLSPFESVFVVFDEFINNKTSIISIDSENESQVEYAQFLNGSYKITIPENGIYQITYSDNSKSKFTIDDIPAPLILNNEWELSFPEGMDTPGQITINELKSWTEFDHTGIKYYSGTAAYRTNFTIPEEFIKPDNRIIIEFNDIGVIADIMINTENVGNFWHKPFEIDITDFIKEGSNELVVEVTNVWRNRLIGDKKYPDYFPNSVSKEKEFKTYLITEIELGGDEELIPSGIIGDVKLKVLKEKVIN